MHDVLIAFGSNLGQSEEILRSTIEHVGDFGLDTIVSAVSRPRTTKPVGGPAGQPDYVNAAIRVKTGLSAVAFHQRLMKTENDLGRRRRQRWGARVVDLDLLLCDDQVIATDSLQVPHPRMSFRRFVLEPACEIAADMIHPYSQCSLGELLQVLNERDNLIGIVPSGSLDDEVMSRFKREIGAPWSVEFAATSEEFARLEACAKLIVIHEDSHCRVVSQVVENAKKFRGPTLWLESERPLGEILSEVAAAATAMLPLHC